MPGPSSSLEGSVSGKGGKPKASAETFNLDTPFEEPVTANTSTERVTTPAEHRSEPAAAPAPAPVVASTTAAPVQNNIADAAVDEAEEPFEVHSMLLWATREATNTAGQSHPDYHRRSDADHFGMEVTEKCVPASVQAHWREAFAHAVEMMMEKTMHGMQHGLLQVAHGMVELIEGTDCGFLAHDGFEKLMEQARRLQVLASAGSLDDLEVAVKYEPLKALNVGGVDIHLELNRLIIGWKLNKGPEEVGRALAAFLKDFREEAAATSDVAAESAPQGGTQDPEVHETRTSAFWVEVLQAVMFRLGGGHELMSESCVSTATARTYGDALEDAIARMLEKTRQGMRAGIEEMAAATVAFVNGLHAPCTEAVGAVHLRTAASRLQVFASAKTLVDFAKHVEYEPMKVLKVGGVDVHKELNRFLAAWIYKQGAAPLADGLVDFMQDFKEHEVADETPAASSSETAGSKELAGGSDEAKESDVLAILRDAITSSSTTRRDEALPESCLSEQVSSSFTTGVEKALEHMLQKRKRSMQLGLKELADVTDEVLGQMEEARNCGMSQDAHAIRQGAQKLRTLTRKTVVDYGTHIKYEAMKSLVVGGVDIHTEINEFISTWKLRSPREAGTPYGNLMRKLVAIKHDEL